MIIDFLKQNQQVKVNVVVVIREIVKPDLAVFREYFDGNVYLDKAQKLFTLLNTVQDGKCQRDCSTRVLNHNVFTEVVLSWTLYKVN